MENIDNLTDLTNLPLSSNQQRLWIISQRDKLHPGYIIQLAYQLEGEINIELFNKSLDILFDKHHTLFSVFKQKNGIPYISIIPREVTVNLIDYSDKDHNSAHKMILAFLGKQSRMPFDIENGPLFRINLLKENRQNFFFSLTVHHLIFDGFSRRLFVQELSRIYTNLINGISGKTEHLKFHSYHFAALEKEAASTENENELIAFWKENLKDCPSELNFHYDFPRCDYSAGTGAREPIKISADSSHKLRQISQESDTSVFNTLLSFLGIFFNKSTGSDDICIGIPVSNRRSSHSFRTLGFFVNTIPVRMHINERSTFRKHLNYSSEVFRSASQNSMPFDKIVNALKPPRINGLNPFFQISFSWINNFTISMDLGGITGKRIMVPESGSPFDMTFSMWENGDIIEGEIEYNTELFRHETIIRIKENLLSLIENLLNNSDIEIGSLHMISEKEKSLISEVNRTETEYSKDSTIIRLFEESAALHPDKTAIVFGDTKLTYSEINEKATRLASVIKSHNIGHGDFVGIHLRRSPEQIISLLALFKSGAAYVPLNLTDPQNRILSILKAADIKSVITSARNELELPAGCQRLNIERLTNQKINGDNALERTVFGPDDPAYIIFTSGTTGTPKGVLVNHKSVINLIEWVNKTFSITTTDKLLWTTNLSFDLSVYDIFGILAAGGTIRIISDEDRLDPRRQYDILLNEGITFWDSAPQSLLQLVPFFNRNEIAALYDSLRLVFLSGDWIPLTLPPAIKSVFSKAVVVGLGGATEATIWSNYFIIDKIRPEWKSIPYGKPIQNAKYYVLDQKLNHCRIGQSGDLYIGGDCLAIGYYNEPALSKSKFIKDPFNPGSNLYFTGDKAQWMEDGNIEFLGRDDDQVKVRGYRVEIGEIRNVVLQNKKIKDAVVIPDKSDRHNIKVILFITTIDNLKPDNKELKKELRKCLPEYMIPEYIIHYKEFPATPNGKMDTRMMLADYSGSLTEMPVISASDDSLKVPETLTHTQLIIHKIWCESLKTTDISIHDNFFDAGGNSLLSIMVVDRIEKAFKIRLNLRVFFDQPVIQSLAESVDCILNAKLAASYTRVSTGEKIIKGEI